MVISVVEYTVEMETAGKWSTVKMEVTTSGTDQSRLEPGTMEKTIPNARFSTADEVARVAAPTTAAANCLSCIFGVSRVGECW